MFDLARLTEVVGGVLGQSAANFNAGDIVQQVSELGLDPAILQQLDPEQLVTMFAENGIDLTNLDPAELSAIAEQTGIGEGLPEIISQFTDRAA